MSDEKADLAINSIELATELTLAWLNNPNVTPTSEDAINFLRSMRGEIEGMANPVATPAADIAPDYVPAVSVRSSVKPDHLISLIDGKKYKSLKRHLSANGLTPTEYRQRYGLKPDYPMVAAEYSAARREVAMKLGLGQKGKAARGKAASAPAPAVVAEPAAAPARPARGAAKANAVAAPETTAAPAKSARQPAKAKTAKAAVAAPKAARSAKVKAAAATKAAKPARSAKPVARPAAEKTAAPKRGWWKKDEAAPAADAAVATPKRVRARKAPAEA